MIHKANLSLPAELPGVGARIQVYVPAAHQWFSGRVMSFNKGAGTTVVRYKSGNEEHLHLIMERYQLNTGA